MTKGQSPEEWVGRDVQVLLEPQRGAQRTVAQPAPITGRLLGVSDPGVTLLLRGGTGEPSTERTLFYPWSVVRRIELAETEEQPS